MIIPTDTEKQKQKQKPKTLNKPGKKETSKT